MATQKTAALGASRGLADFASLAKFLPLPLDLGRTIGARSDLEKIIYTHDMYFFFVNLRRFRDRKLEAAKSRICRHVTTRKKECREMNGENRHYGKCNSPSEIAGRRNFFRDQKIEENREDNHTEYY